jgi:hypothetical protein
MTDGMRVIVCGSRTWNDGDAIHDELDNIDRENLTIIQGGARGADSIARGWALDADVKCEEYPADWNRHGRSAGPIRNREMLDHGADLVIAFRATGESRGTDDMIRESRRRGIPVRVVNA